MYIVYTHNKIMLIRIGVRMYLKLLILFYQKRIKLELGQYLLYEFKRHNVQKCNQKLNIVSRYSRDTNNDGCDI